MRPYFKQYGLIFQHRISQTPSTISAMPSRNHQNALGRIIPRMIAAPSAMQMSPGSSHLRRHLPIKTTAFDRMLLHPMCEAVVLLLLVLFIFLPLRDALCDLIEPLVAAVALGGNLPCLKRGAHGAVRLLQMAAVRETAAADVRLKLAEGVLQILAADCICCSAFSSIGSSSSTSKEAKPGVSAT